MKYMGTAVGSKISLKLFTHIQGNLFDLSLTILIFIKNYLYLEN